MAFLLFVVLARGRGAAVAAPRLGSLAVGCAQVRERGAVVGVRADAVARDGALRYDPELRVDHVVRECASVKRGAVRRAADAVRDDVREQDLGDRFRGGYVVAEVLERCAERGLEVRAVVCGGFLIEGRLRRTLVEDGVDGGPTHPIDLAARGRPAGADRPGQTPIEPVPSSVRTSFDTSRTIALVLRAEKKSFVFASQNIRP